MAGRRWGLCRTDGAKSRAVVFSGGPPADAAQIGMNLDAAMRYGPTMPGRSKFLPDVWEEMQS